jgi:hypothetical protein
LQLSVRNLENESRRPTALDNLCALALTPTICHWVFGVARAFDHASLDGFLADLRRDFPPDLHIVLDERGLHSNPPNYRIAMPERLRRILASTDRCLETEFGDPSKVARIEEAWAGMDLAAFTDDSQCNSREALQGHRSFFVICGTRLFVHQLPAYSREFVAYDTAAQLLEASHLIAEEHGASLEIDINKEMLRRILDPKVLHQLGFYRLLTRLYALPTAAVMLALILFPSSAFSSFMCIVIYTIGLRYLFLLLLRSDREVLLVAARMREAHNAAALLHNQRVYHHTVTLRPSRVRLVCFALHLNTLFVLVDSVLKFGVAVLGWRICSVPLSLLREWEYQAVLFLMVATYTLHRLLRHDPETVLLLLHPTMLMPLPRQAAAPAVAPPIANVAVPHATALAAAAVPPTESAGMPRAVYNMQYTTCSIQCAAYNMQHTVCSIQHAAYSVQHTTCSIQCAAYNMQHTKCSTRNAAYNMQHTTCSIQHAAYSVQHTVCSIQHAACRVAWPHRWLPLTGLVRLFTAR